MDGNIDKHLALYCDITANSENYRERRKGGLR